MPYFQITTEKQQENGERAQSRTDVRSDENPLTVNPINNHASQRT